MQFLLRHRFLAALMAAGVFEQGIISVVRICTSYRAIELGLPVIWLGAISASYALVPIFLAVRAGRYVDRGHDARMCWIGSGLLVVSCAGFALTNSVLGLLVFTILLGVAHLLLYIGLQVLCARDSTPGAMERTFGNFMVANAIGQGLGSSLVGWAGGGANIAPTQFLFTISVIAAVLAFASTLFLRPVPRTTVQAADPTPVPIRDILRVPGFIPLFLVSMISVLAQDLLVVYLPLLGAERGIPVDDIGRMLAIRAGASMVARLLFARLHRLLGGEKLLVLSTFAGAAGYLILAAPIPVLAMYGAIALSGFALGIAVTVAIATSMSLMTADTRGTATSLRMVGNRMAQFVVPFMVSLIAAVTGAAGVFGILALGLAMSATAGHLRRSR